VTAPPPKQDSGTRLPPHLRQGELDRLAVLLRHATGGAWAIALYNTVAVRDDVMDTLRQRLSPLPVYDFTFTSERTNPLAYLQELPKEGHEKRTIIFLYNLTQAGERVWGYLEMQREALAEHPHGLVFWLTPEERGEAVRSAPNFWSQRSGVFDFTIADEATLAQVRGQWAGSPVHFADRADWERQVRLYQGLLDEYQQFKDAPADTMLDLYDKLAYLYYVISDYQRTGELAHRQLALAEETANRRQYAAALTNIGVVYDSLGEPRRALEYYEQALPINREVGDRSGESVTLYNMAMVYEGEENYAEATRLLEQVVAIDETIEHPDLESDRATLARLRNQATGRGLLTALAKKAQGWLARLRG
jgi:tetratricopeptide (TPR) repeat protein